MIPEFAPSGLLPPSEHGLPYRCTPEMVRFRFVDELGAPHWRVRLFEGWDLVRRVVADWLPSATWWLWGCFVSSHADPLWGDRESVSAVVILPVATMPEEMHRRAALVDFLRVAEEQHRVDVDIVYEYSPGHHGYIEYTMEALEGTWRQRATYGVADHRTRELVPAGFLEVGP